MKRYVDYETFKANSIKLADQVQAEFKPTEVIAIVRGGLTMAHIIAKRLRLPVGVYYPGTSRIVPAADFRRPLFVEDLIAQGRTYDLLVKEMDRWSNTNVDWRFATYLVDGNIGSPTPYFCEQTNDWLVMPWEEFDAMQEGDRGFFRDGSDTYGK